MCLPELRYEALELNNYKEIGNGNSSAKVYCYRDIILKCYLYKNTKEKKKHMYEIELMYKLVHHRISPNIIDVYYSKIEGKKCICVMMNKLPGTTLADTKNVSENDKIVICVRILYNCFILHKVCGKEIQHGDLHPENIIVDTNNKSRFWFNNIEYYTYDVYIIDFESYYRSRVRYKTYEFCVRHTQSIDSFIVFLFINLLNVRSDLKNWLVITLSWIDSYKKMTKQLSENILNLNYYDYIRKMKVAISVNNSLQLNKYIRIHIDKFNIKCIKIIKPALQMYDFSSNISIYMTGIYCGSVAVQKVNVLLPQRKIYIYLNNSITIKCILRILCMYDSSLEYTQEENMYILKKSINNDEGTLIRELIQKIKSIRLI